MASSDRRKHETRGLRALFWLAMLIGSGLTARALDPNNTLTQYGHDVWQRRDGLPSSAVQCIAQTPDGYLWLGTPAGLVRFDGVRFTTVGIEPDDPLQTEPITTLCIGPDGTLWIGTVGAGVRSLKNGVASVFDLGANDPSILSIHFDHRGTMFIGSQNGLLAVRGGRDRIPMATAEAYIAGIAEDSAGRLWVATHAGIDCFDGNKPTAIASAGGLVPEVIMADRDDRIWLGTYGGLRCWTGGQFHDFGAADGLLGQHVRALYQDRAGNIWVGSTDGLTRLRPKDGGKAWRADHLPIRGIGAFAEDREGSLWIGTQDGLHRLKDVSVTSWTVQDGLLGNNTSSVIEGREGSLYIFNSSDPAGMSQIKDGVITQHTDLFDGPSFAAPDGSLWVSNTGVLFHLKDGRVQRYGAEQGVPPYWISAMNQDDQGLILCYGSMRGIGRWSEGRAQPYLLRDGTPYTVPYMIVSTYRQADGTLWMAGYDGLWCDRHGDLIRYTTPAGVAERRDWYQAHPQSPTWTRTVVTNGMADCWLSAIAEGPDGALWLASQRGGLTRLRDGEFTPFTTREGLFSNQLNSVLVDDAGDVWMGCSRGIFRVRGAELEAVAAHTATAVRCRVFNTDDGMKSEEAMGLYQPAAWKRRDGTLWFATHEGAVSIDPRRLRRNLEPPPVVVEDLVVDGRSWPLAAPVLLPPGRSKVEFRYTALSLLAPGRVRFKYQLIGYDDQWIDAGDQRVADYTKLPPGPYRFRVIACNDDGVWNEAGAGLAFRLRPFFYQTGWFYALCGLFALSGAAGVHRWRFRHLRAREAELTTRVDQRTAELSRANGELRREISERERAEREVERVHHELMKASRQAGMADVATEVLHNVGNTLNSVNVSASLAIERLRGSRASSLAKVGAMLQAHAGDLATFFTQDRKGQVLPSFLTALAETLAEEQRAIMRELEDVQKNVDHIKAIVARQQSNAAAGGVSEPVTVTEAVEDAIRANTASLMRHQIAVGRDFAAKPVITTDRHKLLQIMVTLLSNAEYACTESGRAEKRIDWRVTQHADRVSVALRDNGVGIPPGNLVRIFAQGFTTRGGGHGFGLHSCALAAKELGGALSAESPGIGQGATFILDLPLQPPPSVV